MIIKWEIIPYPSDKYPDRYKVNIKCDYADLKKIMNFYGKRCGLPWKSKTAEFSFSFYIYKMSPKGIGEFENKIKELQPPPEPVSTLPGTGEKKVPISSRDVSSIAPVSGDRSISGKVKTSFVSGKPESLFSRDMRPSIHSEPRSSVFPPRSSKKQPTSEEIKIAKEISAIIDFDVFEPEKLEAIEIKEKNKGQDEEKKPDNLEKKESTASRSAGPIEKADDISALSSSAASFPASAKKHEGVKKELSAEQRAIPVGIIFRSGQDEFSKIIEDNLLRSVAGKKLKYKIKVAFSKGFLVFSKDDMEDAIALCKEKNVFSVIIVGEPKLAEVLHELLNAAGIFTEHINTTDVNKKSLYFNIATSIILSESGREKESQ